MKQELRLFLTAIQFYTRLPVPRWVGYSDAALNQATRYLPLVGWIVGLVAAVSWLVGSYLVDVSTGLILSMIASVLTTGAFHEDGFADVCDGFGGGWTKARILEIMKDSRIGTYGVVGLLLLLGLKFTLLLNLAPIFQIQPVQLVALLITAHALSRFMAATFLFTHPYVRDAPDSKAKPVAQAGSTRTLVTAGLFAVLPLLTLAWLTDRSIFLILPLLLYAVKWYLGRYFTKWIGGYTGDCLGATQQVCEIGVYILTVFIWKFT
ncbi:adenosylcobinamide-GDP ribazoletransferase [Larkinella harenae]